MSKKQETLTAAVAGILALGVAGMTTAVQAAPKAPTAWEKCAGVARAGMNDCGATDGSHACAGQAKADNMKTEWVYVPEGTCAKIGGDVYKVVKAG